MLIEKAAAKMLDKKILPFWKKLRDNTHGGFFGYVDFDLNVDNTYDKGCILNSRILWFFSESAIYKKDEDLASYADHAYRFLLSNFIDNEYGGAYWCVKYNGEVRDSSKHTYNQAFVIYALSSYYKLRGDEKAKNLAMELYHIIEDKCRDSLGYIESFSRDWQISENEKLSENGVMAYRTMNTLLHILEAYTELYAISHSSKVKQSMIEILSIFEERIYDKEKAKQLVFFDRDFNSIIDLHSYGHDIESSWLVDRACEIIDDEDLKRRFSLMNSKLAAEVLEEAFVGNSIINECENGKKDYTKVWWVQAEGVLGFVNEYQKNSSEKFSLAAALLWNFIEDKIVDPRDDGEWYWSLDKDNRATDSKPVVEPWKCPYHNGRMCLEIMRRKPNVQV